MARKPKDIDETEEQPKAAKAAKRAVKNDPPQDPPKAAKAAKRAAPEPDEGEEEATSSGVKIDRSRYNYNVDKENKTAGGRPSVDSGDALAEAMRGMSRADVTSVAAENGIEIKDNWDNLNEGMFRMTVGNVLRARLKKGESVIVGDRMLSGDGEVEEAPKKSAKKATRKAA